MPEIVKIILILPRFQICGFSRRLGNKKHSCFLGASRGVFPNAGLSHHVSLLKTIFFSRASRGVCFFTRCKLPHEQNGSPRASPQTDLLYLVFPTKRIALPGLPREQILSTWAPPRTELLYLGFPTNRIVCSKSARGGNSVRGEAQVEQFCSWGSPGRAILFVGRSLFWHFTELEVGRDLIGFNFFASPKPKLR